jgi:Cu-Zn family superoxide dismutase
MATVVKASCVLLGEAGVKGVISFEQDAKGGATSIKGSIVGLKPGKHGFHIHQFGDLSNGCVSAGAHFNPFNKTHGGPTDETRHVGDLGNVEADKDGKVEIKIEDK